MKQIILHEYRESIISSVQQTLHLMGDNNFEVITDITEIKKLEHDVLILTDITTIQQVKSKVSTINSNVKIVLYQVENNKVVGFWNEGFTQQNLSMPPSKLDDNMFIRARGRLEKIRKRDILYVESDKKYCTIITTTKKYVLRTALKNLHEQLKNNDFIRIHRSYLINKNHIIQINTQQQNILIGEKEISIGRHYQENLFNEIAILQ